ncbi:unnamed protein product [Caenorhabditis sp. 36 PRJEB53466]|nr:unnamed protein product [Caenorhabditis sp. 36 PRJEB53466]
MKYHFLGDMECPSWLLEEICTNLSDITVLSFKRLCERAAHFMIHDNDFPVMGHLPELINVPTLVPNLNLVGHWLLLKPAGYECPSEDLEKEVVQLGLPPEHGKQLKNVYEIYKDELKRKVVESVHREPHASILNSTSSSLTMQSGGLVYEVSMGSNMMNQFKSDIENSFSKMKDFAGTLPI